MSAVYTGELFLVHVSRNGSRTYDTCAADTCCASDDFCCSVVGVFCCILWDDRNRREYMVITLH